MKDVFWTSIAEYNIHTWPLQLAIMLAGLVLAILLFARPSKRAAAAMKIFFTAESLWIAFVYFMVFGSGRNHSGVMVISWCLVALSWLYDLLTGYSVFRSRSGKPDVSGIVLMMLSFCFPLVSALRGMTWPVMTTPMLPSAVALFMLGVIMSFPMKVNFFAFLFIMHWAVTSLSKVVFFSIPEDLLLAAACIPSVFILLRKSGVREAGAAKPSDRTVSLLLVFIISAIAVCTVFALC